MSVGMVLGKFMPPHLGHQYLFRFARAAVDRLYIVVEHVAGEPIPSTLRHAWIRDLHPDCVVLHLTTAMPQAPEEHPRFWERWREALQAVLPEAPDLVFASEAYGHRLARELGARFMPADPARQLVPVSGTAVRAEPYRHWRYLPGPVRAHYAKRVSVFGPESCGKSTLARDLAEALGTVWVPEYARTYLEAAGRAPAPEDMPLIARGQAASERALAPMAERVLITDTDPLATPLWSEALFGRVDPEVAALAAASRYDLTLLTDVDVPYEPDPVRYLPDTRPAFLDACRRALEAQGRRYVLVRGERAARLAAARAAVEGLLTAP
jgi:HTH-type transcriptional repressor of NAD biosynthesis genes